jgi:hypothetical protein
MPLFLPPFYHSRPHETERLGVYLCKLQGQMALNSCGRLGNLVLFQAQIHQRFGAKCRANVLSALH